MHRTVLFVFLTLIAGPLAAQSPEPGHTLPINFFQRVEPRDLSGLTLRSDGRILAGPVQHELAGAPLAELWWDWEPIDTTRGFIGTGPNGQVLQVELDVTGGTYASHVWADSGAQHLFVLKNLPSGRLLGGGNPDGALFLWNAQGELLAEAQLAADSVLDIVLSADGTTAYVATGNPGLLYHVNLTQFAASSSEDQLSDRGIELVGKVRDRNLRTLTLDANGRVLAGSSPSANLYRFTVGDKEPLVLHDHESGEITDISFDTGGDILLTVVVDGKTRHSRVLQAAKPKSKSNEDEDEKKKKAPTLMEAPPIQSFAGRSEFIRVPVNGGRAETLLSRNKVALYAITPWHESYLLPGGDEGQLLGYDSATRTALGFAANPSAQLNDIAPLGGDRFLLLGNNPSTLSVLNFAPETGRRLQTKALTLRESGHIGALRFGRLRDLDPDALQVELRTNHGRDAVEGWSPWVRASYANGGWSAPDLAGRMVQISLTLPANLSPSVELDQAVLYSRPYNRRPSLQNFRIGPPNHALSPRNSTSRNGSNHSLEDALEGDIFTSAKDAREQAQKALLKSTLLPQAGAQVIYWKILDADGDATNATFSLRHEDDMDWTEFSVGNTAEWTQIDRRTLREGVYFTRLFVCETAPRPEEEQLEISFDTDNLVIDHTAPVIELIDVEAQAGELVIQVKVTDSMTLLRNVRFVFNNGHKITLHQPVDGILDSQQERFELRVPASLLYSATVVDIHASDQADNLSTQRINLP